MVSCFRKVLSSGKLRLLLKGMVLSGVMSLHALFFLSPWTASTPLLS